MDNDNPLDFDVFTVLLKLRALPLVFTNYPYILPSIPSHLLRPILYMNACSHSLTQILSILENTPPPVTFLIFSFSAEPLMTVSVPLVIEAIIAL